MRIPIAAALAFLLFCCSSAAARTVPIPGGTFTIIPVHGDPIQVSRMVIEDDLIFYTLETGQEQFIQMANVANIDAVFELLVSKPEKPPESDQHQPVQEQPANSKVLTVDLGHQKIFGTEKQALAVLNLMLSTPGKIGYFVTYTTDDGSVDFGFDLSRDLVARVIQRKDGTRTGESWTGHVIARLRNAANGSSLDDTPDGKSPGKIRAF